MSLEFKGVKMKNGENLKYKCYISSSSDDEEYSVYFKQAFKITKDILKADIILIIFSHKITEKQLADIKIAKKNNIKYKYVSKPIFDNENLLWHPL